MRKRLLITLSFCFSSPCFAVDYYWQPKITAKQIYDTNLFLRQHPKQDNWLSIISPGLNLGFRTEKDTLSTSINWNQLFYLNQAALNRDEQLYNLKYGHTGDRINWGLTTSYSDQAIVNTVDTGTILGDPSLQTQINIKRQLLNIAPSITYNVDERSQFAFNYSYTDATFDKVNNRSIIGDYDYHQGVVNYLYQYSERDKLNVSLSSSRFQALQIQGLQNTIETTTYNHVAQLGWNHDFDENLVTFFSGGLNYSQAEIKQKNLDSAVETSGIGGVFLATIQKNFDQGFLQLTGSQSQTPTTQGLLTQSLISANSKYELDERLSLGLSANYSTYEATGQTNKSVNRTYLSIMPNISWKLLPEINLALSYTYREQNFTENGISSQGNVVQLQFSYQPELNEQAK